MAAITEPVHADATTDGLRGQRSLFLLFVVVVAFALRVAVIYIWQAYRADPSNVPGWYGGETGSIARSIAEGHGFSSPFGGNTGPTAWVSPAYPYLCAAVFKLFGIFSDRSANVILILNSAFSALTCIPMFRIAERVCSRRIAVASTLVWAVVPFFMRWPTTWMWDMSLSALCLTLICLFAFKIADAPRRSRWAIWAGISGLALLVNPALLTVVAITFAWLVVGLYKQSALRARDAALALVLMAAMIAPWLVRNYAVFGRPVFLRSNFPFEFHLGNYHYSNGMGWKGRYPLGNPAERDKYVRLSELGYVQQHGREAMEFVRQYPREFVDLTLHRIVWFWDGTYLLYVSPEPWKPWMYWALSVPALVGAVFVVCNKRPFGWALMAVVMLYPWPYYLTYTQPRYRHVIEPLLLITAMYFGQRTLETAQDVLRRARFKVAPSTTAG